MSDLTSFVRFKEYENYCFGIIFKEMMNPDGDYVLQFEVQRASVTIGYDSDGNAGMTSRYHLHDDMFHQTEVDEASLVAGFIAHPAYEHKELLSFSFYGTTIEADEFKELSDLLNSNFISTIFHEQKNKLHDNQETGVLN
jgi:hypothetical protein